VHWLAIGGSEMEWEHWRDELQLGLARLTDAATSKM
jgi:hypothetical protein